MRIDESASPCILGGRDLRRKEIGCNAMDAILKTWMQPRRRRLNEEHLFVVPSGLLCVCVCACVCACERQRQTVRQTEYFLGGENGHF